MRYYLLAMIAVAVFCLAGCGGLPAGQTVPTGAGVVVVAVLDKTTNKPVNAEALVVCGGVKATLKVGDGFVVLKNVPLGTDTPPHQPLTVSAKGYTTSTQQVALNASQATYVGATVSVADLTKTGTVQGKFTDSVTGAALVNAVVTFRNTETASSSTSVQAYTASDGTYVATGIPTGATAVTAEAAGYLPATQQITVAPEATGNADLNFALISGETKVTLVGQVIDVRTHSPLQGAQVTVGTLAAVTTGADGKFTILGVQVGSRDLKVTLSGYDEYDATLSVAPGMDSLLITLSTTESTPPSGPYTLAGNVTLVGRSDNSGATVTAFDLTRAIEAARVTTPASGNYTMLLPPGQYRIDATIGSKTIGRTVTVKSGRVVTGINFALTP